MLKRPIFTHDCEDCIFLGRFLKHDLYVHPGECLVARFGDEKFEISTGDYAEAFRYGALESNAEGDRILFEALKRSVAIGILPPTRITEELPTSIKDQVAVIINYLNNLRHERVSSVTQVLIIAATKILLLIED